jgi:hypothetical protein
MGVTASELEAACAGSTYIVVTRSINPKNIDSFICPTFLPIVILKKIE